MHKGGGSSFLVAWVCRTSISSSQAHMGANVRLMKLPAVRQVAPGRLHSLGLWWERCQGIGVALGFGDAKIIRQVLCNLVISCRFPALPPALQLALWCHLLIQLMPSS